MTPPADPEACGGPTRHCARYPIDGEGAMALHSTTKIIKKITIQGREFFVLHGNKGEMENEARAVDGAGGVNHLYSYNYM